MAVTKPDVAIIVSMLALLASAGSAISTYRNSEASRLQARLKAAEVATTLRVYAFIDPNRRDNALCIKVVNEGAPVTVSDLGFEIMSGVQCGREVCYWRPTHFEKLGLPKFLDRNAAFDVLVTLKERPQLTREQEASICGFVVTTATGRYFKSDNAETVRQFVAFREN